MDDKIIGREEQELRNRGIREIVYVNSEISENDETVLMFLTWQKRLSINASEGVLTRISVFSK